MGFLDQEVELLKKLELDRQVGLQRVLIGSAAQLASQRALEEDQSHAPEDNKAIVALLDSLSEMSLGEYLDIVTRHSGYEHQVVLYSRMAYFSDSTAHYKNNYEELTDGLKKVGIDSTWFVPNTEGGECAPAGRTEGLKVLHPATIFRGDDVHPRIARFRFLPPWSESLSEPQEPGIGLAFSRKVGTRTLDEGSGYRNYEEVYKAVYVRLVAPATAVITGNGSMLSITSLQDFDNALVEGFKNPHRYSLQRSRSLMIGPGYG